MKLHGEDVSASNRTGKGDTVMSRPGNDLGRFRFNVVAMHEIEARGVLDPVPKRMAHRLVYLIPAHVRHLEARTVGRHHQCVGKARHTSGKNLEPGDRALLDGLVAGNWSEEDYLVLKPGEVIDASWDANIVCPLRKTHA